MEIDRLIKYIEYIDLENQSPKNILVPSFTFNKVICNNVNFVFMGFAQSECNEGKAIYMSSNLLPEVHVSMDDLLKIKGDIKTDKGIGECDIGKAAEASLDSAVFAITKKHLRPYTRDYDGNIHTEKIFFPLECEVFEQLAYSKDDSILDKYPQWESFKKSPDSRIKHFNYSKYANWYWWEANKASFSDSFCCINYIDGYPISYGSFSDDFGVTLAFCL